MNFQEKLQKAISQGQKSFKYKGEVYDIEDATEADLETYQFGGDLDKPLIDELRKSQGYTVNSTAENLTKELSKQIKDDVKLSQARSVIVDGLASGAPFEEVENTINNEFGIKLNKTNELASGYIDGQVTLNMIQDQIDRYNDTDTSIKTYIKDGKKTKVRIDSNSGNILNSYQFGGNLSGNNLLNFTKNLNNNVNQFGNLGVNIKDVISDDPTQTFNNLIIAMAASQMYNKAPNNIDLSDPMFQSFQQGGFLSDPTLLGKPNLNFFGSIDPMQQRKINYGIDQYNEQLTPDMMPLAKYKRGLGNKILQALGLQKSNIERQKSNQAIIQQQAADFTKIQNPEPTVGNSLFNGDTLNQLPTILSLFSSLANMKKGGEVKYEDIQGMNIGNKIPIQAETQNGKPEYVGTADGVLAPVKARQPHSEMPDNKVTDLLEEGDYVFSSDKNMKMNWEVPVGVNTGGEYKEGKKTKEPTVVNLSDILNFKESVPSKAAEVIGRRFKVEDLKKTERMSDPFTNTANDLNKEQRNGYLDTIKAMSEERKEEMALKKQKKELNKFLKDEGITAEEFMIMQAMMSQGQQAENPEELMAMQQNTEQELPMAQWGISGQTNSSGLGLYDPRFWQSMQPAPGYINPFQQSPAFGMPQGLPTFNYDSAGTGSSGGSGRPKIKVGVITKAVGAIGDIAANITNMVNTRKSMKEFMNMYRAQRKAWEKQYEDNKEAESTSATIKSLGVLGTKGPEQREISDYLVSNLNPERNANIRNNALKSSASSFLSSSRQNPYLNSLVRSARNAEIFDKFADATQQTASAYIQDIVGRDTALQGYYQSLLDEDFRVNQGNTDLENWRTNNLAGLAAGNVRDLAAIDTNALQTDNQFENAYLAAQKARRDAVSTGIRGISSSIGKIG